MRATVKRFHASGLSWPLPEELNDATLEAKLFAEVGTKRGHRRLIEPDWAALHRELKRKHVTPSVLWDGYIERYPEGYRYPRFCELYRSWEGRVSVTMRQTHVGGDKLFGDYAGDTVPVIVDRLTGEVRPAQIFVAVMGASNFTYAEPSWTQGLGDWIGAHTRAFVAVGGVPRLLVPDNAKVAVIKACLYEPQVNRTYAEMAAHYGTAVLPARPYRPRDKAKVEATVLVVERWILARLRNRQFYSLAELNAAIAELIRRLNEERPTRRLGVTRRQFIEELDRPALKPLPVEPYVFAEWRIRRVGIDYHVDVEDHFYSVPYRFARGLDRTLFQKLAEGGWIDAHENLILCGPTGVGKSWLASALGHKSFRDNRSVLYQRTPKLFADLALARGDGRYARILRALGGVQLLILDDRGLEPLDATARHDLLEIPKNAMAGARPSSPAKSQWTNGTR